MKLSRWLRATERRAVQEADAVRNIDPKLARAIEDLAGRAGGLAEVAKERGL